ncbi:hypothetical protein FA95DRAFT_18435 [Auriscalpium vulgare]|uniref:Uncharacterized protein n=1 Tax=Auriscalpium vulgare TaxID=40419 RepID=A0ACB8SBU7_9AGAM|nr:hypothetical protein FA95DRAFT_18435 [Auriscalpium vulgare]
MGQRGHYTFTVFFIILSLAMGPCRTIAPSLGAQHQFPSPLKPSPSPLHTVFHPLHRPTCLSFSGAGPPFISLFTESPPNTQVITFLPTRP